MNKIERLTQSLRERGLDENDIEEIISSMKPQPRTHRLYKIYLNEDQASQIRELFPTTRFELANPIEKQRKYNPRKNGDSS
ncbi:MAG: hypothetical protein ACXABY_29545 [Candidatus Thorarchaeota archaeon]|jgi:hypothetical protein